MQQMVSQVPEAVGEQFFGSRIEGSRRPGCTSNASRTGGIRTRSTLHELVELHEKHQQLLTLNKPLIHIPPGRVRVLRSSIPVFRAA